ncbi:DUF4440 domain-containing protein [Actinoplanes sp. NPDC049265]|uniref:DUF4440 domain-containing protein n=1 Tax=Actinoplanes sp. NPDC049265 TaxID=3363902 RepID=UPI00371265E1
MTTDHDEIAAIVRTFFAAFSTDEGVAERMAALRALFLPRAVVIRTCGGEPTVYDVESFIAPREAMLTDGRLTDFREWAGAGHTDLYGDIAHHFCAYGKTGGRGMKSLQLVRTGAGWRISAAAWDDERVPTS